MPGDFVCTSANDGTHLFRPISARGHTFWQNEGLNRFVIDNNEDNPTYLEVIHSIQELDLETKTTNFDELEHPPRFSRLTKVKVSGSCSFGMCSIYIQSSKRKRIEFNQSNMGRIRKCSK